MWLLLYRYLLVSSVIACLMTPSFGEIITTTLISSVLIASGWYKWEVVKDNTICRCIECCNTFHIPFNLTKLKSSFNERMFGQPLVKELVNILRAHREGINEQKNRKALVLSFHGWSGVGKNYAATMIAEAVYKNGMNSKFVKMYMGEKDFDCTNLQQTKKKLIEDMEKTLRSCPTSLIIFDEVHDMCPFVLDAIKPMLDHHNTVNGVNYRDAIFIFISNIGGQEIAYKLLELYSEGVKRNEVEFHNFEPILRRTAYYTGGFEKSTTIAQHLIDYYIPFLPMEQQHVEMCVRAEFRFNGIDNPTEEMISDALSITTYGPTEDQPIFANNGCKRFAKHIPYIIQKNINTEL